MAHSLTRHPTRTTLPLLGLLFTGSPAVGLEQPGYTVILREGPIEFREYAAYRVAETIIEDTASYTAAGNEGFRRLFRYISGGNRSQEKIAMTAPVEQAVNAGEKIAMTAPVEQAATGAGWRVAFVLPSQYSLDTAPVPTDPRVRLREVPARRVAVLQYSGRWSEQNFSERAAELEGALVGAGVTPLGPVQAAMYNGPFVPPFLRRNEVMVAVAGLPPGA